MPLSRFGGRIAAASIPPSDEGTSCRFPSKPSIRTASSDRWNRSPTQTARNVRSLDSPLLKAYGIMGWKGTSEELDRLLAEIDSDEDDLR
jgi:hypothetical protein